MLSVGLILAVLIVLGVLSNAFTVLALSGIIVVIGYKFKDLYIRAYIFYTVAFIVTVLGIVFYKDFYTRIIQGGLLGYSFFLVVMFVGVLPNKSVLARNIKRNRGMFSILGFIFITCHAYLHLFTSFGEINLFGLASYVIMVPLTIISFKVIRTEITPKDWFAIQKAAYAIYVLLFVHLFLVSNNENRVVYAVIGALYINNRVLKEIRK